MTVDFCHREDELLDALGRGFVGAELSGHVAECAPCTELRLVAGALLEDRAESVEHAHVPAAGTMWWRMRVRQNHEAQASARQALLIGQALTLTIALALVYAFFGDALTGTVRQVAMAVRMSTPLLFALAVFILTLPIAGWVAIRQK